MFNQYLALTPENADIAMVNVVLEDLKFIVISLDQIFRGHAGEDYYNEEHTFYFYHLQHALQRVKTAEKSQRPGQTSA